MLERPILVTGIHRSGTTFVGRMLSESPNTLYLWEPFQAGLKSNNQDGIFDFWYEFKSGDDKSQAYSKFLSNYSKLSLKDLRLAITWNKDNRIFYIRNALRKLLMQMKFKQYRLLLKDPISVFSVPWIDQISQELKVIVLLREPVGFVNSLLSLGWDIGIQDIAEQEELMNWLPDEYSTRVNETCIRKETDIVKKAVLLWEIVYLRVLEYMETNPEWMYVKLEDITQEPDIFRKMFEYCELDQNNDIRHRIVKHYLKRSDSVTNSSRSDGIILDPDTAEFVRKETEGISHELGYNS
ncbi:MAG: sulfotransferase [Sphaerochaetaceae bacterium]|nr:sulfotransferase [Sphaerochaetaceae bacterium]